MSGLKRLAGAYMVIVAVVVALFFIINPFLSESIDVPGVWGCGGYLDGCRVGARVDS